MDSKQKGIVIVAVIIVIIAAVFAAQALNDKHDGASDDTYYFYLDGMDSNTGWYSATGDDVESAFLKAMEQTDLTITMNKGWVTIEQCPSSYDSATGTGKGLGIFEYISTDVSQPYPAYFVSGPAISSVSSNIVYIVYSDYTMDSATYDVTYAVNPTSSSAWQVTGPFSA